MSTVDKKSRYYFKLSLSMQKNCRALDTCLKVILENVGQTKSQFHGCDEKAP